MTENITVLPGVHVSPETAYLLDDYPYGFRLRCKIRYWLDVHPKRGTRLLTQTSNPKAAGLVWNKPKAGTYSLIAGALYLDDEGHVQHAGLTEYTNGSQALAWRDTFGSGVHESSIKRLDLWVKAKLAYDAKVKALAEESV